MFETLGHYKILDRLGAGGLGEVYRARDTRLGRTVAIKVLTADIAGDPDRRARLVRDARATVVLSHPNIAALYEIGEDQDQLFLAFEYVPGETLKKTIAGRPLNPRRAIDLAVQIADALADAHAAGIIHRDITSDNIFVTPKGNAKLLDFGLAAWTANGAARAQAVSRAAAAAETPGTLAYMSPEQALGERGDHRTDIFSLGVILFEMVTGRQPFTGGSATDLALQIVQASAPAPSTINKALPVELDVIVAKAMAKSLDQRYQSAATLAAELRSVGAILDVRSDMLEAANAAVPSRPAARSGIRWIVLLALLAAVSGAAWYERAWLQRTWRHSIGPPPAPIVAILPFDADPSQHYFADGLAEDLTTRLGQSAGLSVVGRSRARQYRGRQPVDAARELGAAVVLTGSLQAAGDPIALSLALIDPSDGAAIWSADYTRDAKAIFAMQAQVAEDVSRALRVTVQPTAAGARTASHLVDPHAYDQYLRGRQSMAKRQLAAAVSSFEQATAADPGLGEAFAALAEALHLEIQFAGVLDDEAHRLRETAAAKRAYEVDPDLADANVAMGLTSDALADTLKYFRRAIELDPSYAAVYHLVGDELLDFDPEQAVAFYQKSLERDPRLLESQTEMAGALERLGRHGEAQQARHPSGSAPIDLQSIAGGQGFTDLHREGSSTASTERIAAPATRTAPGPWVGLVLGLRAADRADEALTEASALASRFPKDCEGRVVLAALRLERRDAAAAHRLADGPLGAAGLDPHDASAVRCGLHAAAALQNPGLAAALLDRLSGNEPMLRAFARDAAGQTGSMWIDPRTYPWSLIARDPIVAEARQRLDAAYARERETARAVLKGLP
jgi:eukaryotic-like serine/threonine-protein kinase